MEVFNVNIGGLRFGKRARCWGSDLFRVCFVWIIFVSETKAARIKGRRESSSVIFLLEIGCGVVEDWIDNLMLYIFK